MDVSRRSLITAALLVALPAAGAPPVALWLDTERCPRYRLERVDDDLAITCPRLPQFPAFDAYLRVEWYRVVGWYRRCSIHTLRHGPGGDELFCLTLVQRTN